jgi:hypothetical protein
LSMSSVHAGPPGWRISHGTQTPIHSSRSTLCHLVLGAFPDSHRCARFSRVFTAFFARLVEPCLLSLAPPARTPWP